MPLSPPVPGGWVIAIGYLTHEFGDAMVVI
jgi:hypothetical protein